MNIVFKGIPNNIFRSNNKKRREKKEDNVVKPQIKLLCLKFGIKVFEIQASNYDPRNKSYSIQRHAPKGFPDLCGIGPGGISVFIELKAPKKRSTLSLHQRDFLIEAINHEAFGCVSDSMEHFSSLWLKWKEADLVGRKKLLIDDLPPEPKRRKTKKY